jgi:hypothetical protein
MVGDAKRDPLAGLMGLMAGPGLGVGSFGTQGNDSSDEFGRDLDTRWMSEFIHLSDRLADDQRNDLMRVIILRALAEITNKGDTIKGIDTAALDRASEQLCYRWPK